jgi:hypothetical protein
MTTETLADPLDEILALDVPKGIDPWFWRACQLILFLDAEAARHGGLAAFVERANARVPGAPPSTPSALVEAYRKTYPEILRDLGREAATDEAEPPTDAACGDYFLVMMLAQSIGAVRIDPDYNPFEVVRDQLVLMVGPVPETTTPATPPAAPATKRRNSLKEGDRVRYQTGQTVLVGTLGPVDGDVAELNPDDGSTMQVVQLARCKKLTGKAAQAPVAAPAPAVEEAPAAVILISEEKGRELEIIWNAAQAGKHALNDEEPVGMLGLEGGLALIAMLGETEPGTLYGVVRLYDAEDKILAESKPEGHLLHRFYVPAASSWLGGIVEVKGPGKETENSFTRERISEPRATPTKLGDGASRRPKASSRPSRPPAPALPILPDALWERVKPLLPAPPKPKRPDRPGRPRKPDLQCLIGILHVLATGIAWEDLPAKDSCGMTCLRRLVLCHSLIFG